jgi:hypothetical protein
VRCGNRFLKIDTVAAELVLRKRRAASVLNSRRRILRKFRNTTSGGVRRGGAWALGVNPARRVRARRTSIYWRPCESR